MWPEHTGLSQQIFLKGVQQVQRLDEKLFFRGVIVVVFGLIASAILGPKHLSGSETHGKTSDQP